MKEILIPTRTANKSLHGNIYLVDNSAPFIILCHGFTGNQREHGRFDRTAEELNKRGYNALTFDFAGSGKNIREAVTLTKQAHNLEDVFKWVETEGYQKISTIGLSFGGMTALVANLPKRHLAVFWAPAFYINRQFPLMHKIKLKFAGIMGKTPVLFGDTDQVLIDYSFMSDKNNKMTDPMLREMNIPVLMIHGDADITISPSISAEAYDKIQDKSDKQRVLVNGAGHDFDDAHLDEFISHTITFLNKYH